MDDALLQVEHLKKYYPARGNTLFVRSKRTVKAVDDVSFSVNSGEVVAVVGESGCGKSTLGRLVIRLLEPTAGAILFNGLDITKLSGDSLRQTRLLMQIVFQDPFSSLNPRMTAGDTVVYPLKVNRLYKRRQQVIELLERVGLNADHARRFPHELSGGQRQRIGIARAIAVNPKLVVLDEPIASLDLSAQAHVLNLFKELQREMGMAYIFITHDLSVAEYMADRILVMYAGKIMEIGNRKSIFESPKHPYTEALLSAAVLGSWRDTVKETILEGDPPNPIDPPSGCRFHTRCPYVGPICKAEEPPLVRLNTGQLAACHLLTGKLERQYAQSKQVSP
jgi:peptide/nickel transport system ATP-binding protein